MSKISLRGDSKNQERTMSLILRRRPVEQPQDLSKPFSFYACLPSQITRLEWYRWRCCWILMGGLSRANARIALGPVTSIVEIRFTTMLPTPLRYRITESVECVYFCRSRKRYCYARANGNQCARHKASKN